MSKKICLLALCMVMMFLTACSGGNSVSSQNNAESSYSNPDNKTSKEETTISDSQLSQTESKSLVVYFSVTGNTEKIANTISEAMSADVYEIIPANPYTTDDIDYKNDNCRANKEQNDKTTRPKINGSISNWSQYDTIIIGYPIWWGEEPRIIDTFVENYDFTDKTITTFCTSGSSDIGNSGKNLEVLAKNGKWLDGKRFSNDVTKDELADWLKDLGISLK